MKFEQSNGNRNYCHGFSSLYNGIRTLPLSLNRLEVEDQHESCNPNDLGSDTIEMVPGSIPNRMERERELGRLNKFLHALMFY